MGCLRRPCRGSDLLGRLMRCMQRVIPVVEAESADYAVKVKFVNINVDDNRKLADQLAVKDIKAVMLFRRVNAVATASGKTAKDKVAEMLQGAAAR